MHELSLAYEILTVVRSEAEKHGLRRIHEVVVSYGDGSGCDPRMIRTSLSLLQADSFLSGAEIVFQHGQGLDIRVERIRGSQEEPVDCPGRWS